MAFSLPDHYSFGRVSSPALILASYSPKDLIPSGMPFHIRPCSSMSLALSSIARFHKASYIEAPHVSLLYLVSVGLPICPAARCNAVGCQGQKTPIKHHYSHYQRHKQVESGMLQCLESLTIYIQKSTRGHYIDRQVPKASN